MNILARRPIDPRNRFTVAINVYPNEYTSSEKNQAIRQGEAGSKLQPCELYPRLMPTLGAPGYDDLTVFEERSCSDQASSVAGRMS